ncbi:MAG: endonuclease III [Planctomycetota bacterium]
MRERKVDPKQARKIVDLILEHYPDAKCALEHNSPFQLLVATVLSAQCTDERVNKVTKELFKKYDTPPKFANLPQETLEKEIYSTGFYKNKAKNIRALSKILVEKYNGEVPKSLEELLTLPGVARKTANVVMGTAFNIPTGIVVDTHVKRLSFRMGLSLENHPNKIEEDLMKIVPKDKWIQLSFAMINHGRQICNAKKPLCTKCFLNNVCPKNGLK